MPLIFITGIDTGIGKTLATGLLARYLLNCGATAITAKIVQTGASDQSSDIAVHRRLMGIPLTDWDARGLTCPYVFAYPSSPHLAARLENRLVEPAVIDRAMRHLEGQFDYVLLEGVGGVSVPLTAEYTTLDYLAERKYPCLVVSAPRLGSINHTLLTLEALHAKAIPILGLCYSLGQPTPAEITADTPAFLQNRYPQLPLVIIPPLDLTQALPDIDFSSLKF